ncbi:hypothetical protein MRX96_039521 [Rhipicephalus microplus]
MLSEASTIAFASTATAALFPSTTTFTSPTSTHFIFRLIRRVAACPCSCRNTGLRHRWLLQSFQRSLHPRRLSSNVILELLNVFFTITRIDGLLEVLRLLSLFIITLPNFLCATLTLFVLAFALLGLLGLFLDNLLHLRELFTVRVLRTFVGTPFVALRNCLITHLSCIRSAVQLSFSVFLGLGSDGVILLDGAVAVLVCRLPIKVSHVKVTLSVPFLFYPLLLDRLNLPVCVIGYF